MPLKHGDMDMRPKNWIQSVVSSPKFHAGAFTRKAKKHGMTTQEFMRKVLGNPEEYDSHTRHQAQFMKNVQH